jgi:uncharacterized protein (TIGR02099 family)
VRDWLQQALHKGSSNDTRLTLKGNLADFPFADGRDGEFVVAIKAQGATLAYAPGWPVLSDIEADVRFEGARMAIVATQAKISGATVGKTTVEIPDLSADFTHLIVNGEASGATTQFLNFVAASPVAEWIGHATDGLEVSGNGRLSLRLDIPLDSSDPARVAGDYQLIGNQLRFAGVPKLEQVNGRLSFTEASLAGSDIAAETLGGSTRVDIRSKDGNVVVNARGSARLAAIRAEWGGTWLDRASGTADYQLTLDARGDTASWSVESSLRGVRIDLPAPVGKVAEEAVALRVQRRPLRSGRDEIRVDYGRVGRLIAQRRIDTDPVVDRALVLLGKAAQRNDEPDRNGLSLRGDVVALNVDDWLALAREPARAGGSAATPALDLVALDLEAATLDALGRGFHDVTLGARRSGSDWRIRLDAREVEGTASWQPASAKFANGRLVARLARLAIPEAGELPAWSPSADPAPAPSEGSPNPWPDLDLVADRYQGRRGELGRLELAAKPDGTDWKIEKLALVNDAGELTAQGRWRSRGRDQQTRLDVALDVRDAPAYLGRFGLPDAVKGARTRIEGQLAWNGAPTDFDYPTLGGSFRVNVGPGQFTKIEPGLGKLLGVLSLQALPRRITLDFRDIFSEGFAFDSISGDVGITNGVMHSENLLLRGPAARVTIAGDVDLERETQRLNVRVQPSLATSVSAGAGAAAIWLLAANPLVGAAVGAGTLLAQKVMKDPIEQMFSYEYAVSGSWEEPIVEKLGGRAFAGGRDAGESPGVAAAPVPPAQANR